MSLIDIFDVNIMRFTIISIVFGLFIESSSSSSSLYSSSYFSFRAFSNTKFHVHTLQPLEAQI